MALTARFLIDTSAAARMPMPHVAARLAPLIESGLVATTAVLNAEALYSARNPVEYEQLWEDRRVAYEYLPTNDEHLSIRHQQACRPSGGRPAVMSGGGRTEPG